MSGKVTTGFFLAGGFLEFERRVRLGVAFTSTVKLDVSAVLPVGKINFPLESRAGSFLREGVEPLVFLGEAGPGVCSSSAWSSKVEIVDLLPRKAGVAFFVGMVDKDDLLVEVRVKTAFAVGGGDTSAAVRVRGGSQLGGTDPLPTTRTPKASLGAKRRYLTDLSDNPRRGGVGVFLLLGGVG